MSGKQCNPDLMQHSAASDLGSTLFAQAGLSQYLGLLQYLRHNKDKIRCVLIISLSSGERHNKT